MLIGEYQHTLDPKGRVNFPARLRESLGSTFIITKGLDNCLYVYSMEEWKVLEDKIRALPMSKSATCSVSFLLGPLKRSRISRAGCSFPPICGSTPASPKT